MANNILSGLLGQSSPSAYSPYVQKPTGSMLIGDALQAIGAAMMAPPTQRGMIFSQALEDAKNRRRQEQQDAMTAYRQDQQFRLAQQGQARADQEWQWKEEERKAEAARQEKLRGVVASAFANSSAGVPGAPNYAGVSSGYNPQTAAAKPYYDAGMYPEAFDVLYGPKANQQAPNVQKFYDDKGQEYYAQWVNGQWQQVGGAAPKSDRAVNVDARQMGTIPPGYRAEYDEKGNVIQLVPIPGGPVATEQQALAEKQKSAAEQKQITNDVVLENIGAAKKLAGGMAATGLTGQIMSNIGGTSAKDLQSRIDAIKANIGFDRLQRMRVESPTGGALGQVAVQELEMLQATLGSLDIGQSQGQLLQTLDTIERLYKSITERNAKYGTGAPVNHGGAPADVPADVWEAMTPEEKSLWQ